MQEKPDMRKLKKRILKSSAVIGLAAFLLAIYIKFVGKTTKWKVINPQAIQNAREVHNNSFIVVFWHGRLMMIPIMAPKDIQPHVLISRNSDGELISRIQAAFGFKSIRGSSAKACRSEKGGITAIREMLKIKEKAEVIAITPDGPRGPARKVSPNTLEILKKLEMPVIPVTFSCTRFKQLNSWDRFIIAKPFGKGVLAYGDVVMPENLDQLETAMNKLTDEADFVAKTL